MHHVSIPVVFIAGSGRTGSTLLSLLLSQSPGTRNVGQARDLAKAVAAGATCLGWSTAAPLTEGAMTANGGPADTALVELEQRFISAMDATLHRVGEGG